MNESIDIRRMEVCSGKSSGQRLLFLPFCPPSTSVLPLFQLDTHIEMHELDTVRGHHSGASDMIQHSRYENLGLMTRANNCRLGDEKIRSAGRHSCINRTSPTTSPTTLAQSLQPVKIKRVLHLHLHLHLCRVGGRRRVSF